MNILGKRFSVKLEKDLMLKQGLMGLFSPDKSKIFIDDSLKGYDFNQTLMHEFFHAVFYRCGLAQTRISPDLQEIIVENFATAIVENMDYLKKNLK